MSGSAIRRSLPRVRAEVRHWVRALSGQDDQVVQSVRRLVSEVNEIMATAGPFEAAPKSQRVAVMSGHGLNAIHLSCDALWLMAMRQRGHHGIGILCGRGVPSCEFNSQGDGSVTPFHIAKAFSPWANSALCVDCTGNAHSVLAATGAPTHRLGSFGRPEDLQSALTLAARIPANEIRDFRYKRVPVGDHAFSSTLRCTLRGVVDLDDAKEIWIYRRHLASSIILTDRLNRLIDRERPDKVIGVHGVYLMHGTMADVCRTRDIPTVIYGMPYRKGTIWLSHGETYHRSLVDEPTSFWENETLDERQAEVILEYLRSREVGGRDNVNYHPNPILDRQKVAEAVGVQQDKPIISMFTNVIWDAQIHYPSNAFENIFDWVFFTIEWFRERPDMQLVIRIHPAETKGGLVTGQPMFPEIARQFPVLPPNVFVLPSESDIGSYALAEMSKACLIFGTKMGVEIAARGIPVIVAGETFNRGKGFTYDVATKADYAALLDRASSLPANSPDVIARARRYAYYLFFQKMMDTPLLGANLARAARQPDEKFYTFSELEDIGPGKDRTLDVICDGILAGGPLFHPLRG